MNNNISLMKEKPCIAIDYVLRAPFVVAAGNFHLSIFKEYC